MTPPLKPVGSAPTPVFPEGVTVIEGAFFEDLVTPIESELIPQITSFELDRGRLASFGSRLFENGHYRVSTKFKEGMVSDALKIPWVGVMADLSIDEGAKICADFETRKSLLYWPERIALHGFSLWKISPDRAELDDEGHLQVRTGCCLSWDKTNIVLESPLRTLFPEKKITPIPLEEIFLFDPVKGPLKQRGIFSKLVDALSLIGFWGEVCRDPLCMGPSAGVALYVDYPILQQTFISERFKAFDFTGVRADSFIDWPAFPLSFLPLPPGIEIPEGMADISGRYDPVRKTTSLMIDNLDAKILIPDLFGEEPVHLTGGITVTLQAGGEIRVQLNQLKVELPSLPSKKYDGVSLSSVLSGDLQLHWDLKAEDLVLKEARISINPIELKTDPGRGIRFGKDGIAFGFSLQGNAGIDYVSSNPVPLQTRWDFSGSATGELKSQILQLTEGFFKGEASWREINGQLLPEKAALSAGTKVKIGGLEFSPSLRLDILSREEGDGFVLLGDGDFSLTSSSPEIRLGSNLHFETTDLKTLDWSAQWAQDQIIGDLVAKGEMTMEGKIGLSGGGNLLKSFKIATEKPYILSAGDSVIAKDVTITGKGARGDSVIHLKIPSLAHRARVSIDLYDLPWRDRLVGNYRVRVKPQRVSEEFALEDVNMRGKIFSPILSEIFAKKRIFLKGSASALAEGGVSGPIAADYEASLRFAPEKSAFVLSFRSDRPSMISMGPLKVKGDKIALEGAAQLQGSILARYSGGGVAISGDDLGIKKGRIFVGLNGPIPVDDQGQKIPAVFDLEFVADQLSKIRGGVAYCGGRRCRLEAVVDLLPLKAAFDPDRSKLRIFKTPHRVQLSPAAWWRALRGYVVGHQ